MNVIHDTPGRLRVAVPAVLGSRDRALACEDAVYAVPGVRQVLASPVTGNLLVLYSPSLQVKDAILQRCAAWSGAPGGSRACAHGHRAGAVAGSGAAGLAAEVVRHVLPLVFGSCPICRGR